MQNLRKILLPFAWLYGLVVWLRNKMFDYNWLSSKRYDIPVVTVGNLSVGGTGKSPMIEYLIRLTKEAYQVATLSRGYKRKTTGYYLLSGAETASQVGDEPLQFKTKYPGVQVAVDADRQEGIQQLRRQNTAPEIIFLDDAFQHRKVEGGMSLLLTAYDNLYVDDLILPAGNLREPKSGARRADIIVVTKCPSNLSPQAQSEIIHRLNLQSHQTIYFSFIDYAEHVINTYKKISIDRLGHFCLVTGIAKPQPLVDFLNAKGLSFSHRRFADHHNFSGEEIARLNKEDLILTTEKDFMRLKDHIAPEKLFYLPIRQEFVTNKEKFDAEVLHFFKSTVSSRG